MSKILDKATEHFRSKLSEELQSVLVPEWGNTKIYFKSVVTLREQGKMIELAGQGKQVEALVESLIIKARNEDGTKMFNMADKVTLLNEVDPSILIRVVSDINNAGAEPTLDEVEKN